MEFNPDDVPENEPSLQLSHPPSIDSKDHRYRATHPACVPRPKGGWKRNGFVRPHACGATMRTKNVIRVVRAAHAPHAYTNDAFCDMRVPEWVAVVLVCVKGRAVETAARILTSVVKHTDDEWRSAFVTAWRLGGVVSATLMLPSK